MINIAKPQLGEEGNKSISEVLDSSMIPQGQRVKATKEAFTALCGVKYAISTTSGTAALHVSMLAVINTMILGVVVIDAKQNGTFYYYQGKYA